MDRAINKSTNQIISAFEIFKNGSYQNLDKGEWIAPTDSISNWDELEKLGIKEIPVHYVKEKEYSNYKGTDIWSSPHFAIYPNSPAKTTEESALHKMLKNFLFNRLKSNDISFVYSTANKKSTYSNIIKLSELNIDWNEYDIEVQIGSRNKLRADILLPFKSKDFWLGKGIFLEVQLSKQNENQTFDRSIGRALQGYSTVWFFKEDFVFDNNEEVVDLTKKEFKLFSFSSELKHNGSKVIRQLKETVESECRYLDEKLSEVKKSLHNVEDKSQNIYDNLKSQIDGYFGWKTKEIGDGFSEKIAQRIQENFFEKNKEEIENIIIQSVPKLLTNELKEKGLNQIDKSYIEKEIISNIEIATEIKTQSILLWKQLIENPPICPKCKAHSRLIQKKNGQFVYHCKLDDVWINIPYSVQEQIKSLWNN